MSTWVSAGQLGVPSLLGGLRRPVGRRAAVPAAGRGRVRRSATPLRLTRRGRAVLGGALLLVLMSSAVFGRLGLASAGGTPVADAATDGAASAVARQATDGAGSVGSARQSSGSRLAEEVAAGELGVPAGWSVVTAAPGDSLWSVARRATSPRSPSGVDTRDVVEQIVARNGLIGTEIAAGDQLLVPTP